MGGSNPMIAPSFPVTKNSVKKSPTIVQSTTHMEGLLFRLRCFFFSTLSGTGLVMVQSSQVIAVFSHLAQCRPECRSGRKRWCSKNTKCRHGTSASRNGYIIYIIQMYMCIVSKYKLSDQIRIANRSHGA